MSESLNETLKQRRLSLKALADPLPELIRLKMAVPLTASEADQVRRQLVQAEERQRQLQQQIAALHNQVEEWRKAYLESQNEIVRLKEELAASVAQPMVTTELSQILKAEVPKMPEETHDAQEAIRDALAAIPDLPEIDAPPLSMPQIWVLAPQGPDEWADELAGYLDEFGLGLVWAQSQDELPEPFQDRGLLILADDPTPYEDLMARIPNSLAIPATHLMRAKIALLDHFIRGGR